MRARIFVCGLLIFTLVSVFGCAKPSPVPSPAPAPAPTQTPTPTPKPTASPAPSPSPTTPAPAARELTLAHPLAVGSLNTITAQNWMAYMAKASNGQIKFKEYPAETLVKAADQHKALQSGAIDAAYYIAVNFVGQEKINQTSTTPLLFNGPEHQFAFMQDPEVRALFTKRFREHGIEWLGVGTFTKTIIFSVDKPLVNLADWKGLPVRSFSGLSGTWMEKAGASVLTIPSADLYTAAQRGMVKGYVTAATTVLTSGLTEVTKYFTDVLFAAPVNMMMMNKKVFDSLPANMQSLLINESKAVERAQLDYYLKEEAQLMQELVKKGMTRSELTKQQADDWRNLAKTLWDEWYAKELGADGPALLKKVEQYRR